MIKYVITAIKSNGERMLAFANDSRNSYDTDELATTAMNNVKQNNSKERVAELVGTDLKVLPVECYPGGDAIKKSFDK